MDHAERPGSTHRIDWKVQHYSKCLYIVWALRTVLHSTIEMRYVHLFKEQGPYILTQLVNNFYIFFSVSPFLTFQTASPYLLQFELHIENQMMHLKLKTKH